MNRETRSLWYITEWEIDIMNVNDSIVWVFILKDFLEELYLYIKNNKTERRMGIPGVYSKSGTGMIRKKPE